MSAIVCSAKKVVLYSDNSSEYAKGITKSFKEAYKGDIVVEETYQSGDQVPSCLDEAQR